MMERNERPSDRWNRHSRRTGSTHRWYVGRRLRKHLRRACCHTRPTEAKLHFLQLN